MFRNFWRSCLPTWTPSVHTWPEGVKMETMVTASECSASDQHTWPRPCYDLPIQTSALYPVPRTRTKRMMTMTITVTGVGGLPGGNDWRTVSSGGWFRQLVVGFDPRYAKEVDYTPVAQVRGQTTTPGTGLTLWWYVPIPMIKIALI